MAQATAPRYLATLAGLEARRIRAFWRIAARDPVFDLVVLAGLWIAFANLRKVCALALREPPAVAASLAAAAGALLFVLAYGGEGSKARERLLAGPFHALICQPGRLERWMAWRALAFSLAWAFAIAIPLASLDLVAAGVFILAASVGVAVAVAASLALRRRGADAPPIRPASVKPGAARPMRLAPRHPLAIVALSGARRGPIPPLILIVLAGAASRVADANNGGPQVGYALCVIAAWLAAALLMPRGRLPGLLGQQPVSLPRLFLWLYAAPLTAAILGGLAAGLIGGLGAVGGLEVAVAAATGLLILSWFAFLHRLIRSQRHAGLATALELAAALFMASVETSLAPLWLVGRGAILVRTARRRRWLDR